MAEMREFEPQFYMPESKGALYSWSKAGPQRWDARAGKWVMDTDFYGEVLDGTAYFDLVPEEEARRRFPEAFVHPPDVP